MTGLIRRESSRHVCPWRACTQHPQYGIKHLSRRSPRSTSLLARGTAFFFRDVRLDGLPLRVGKLHLRRSVMRCALDEWISLLSKCIRLDRWYEVDSSIDGNVAPLMMVAEPSLFPVGSVFRSGDEDDRLRARRPRLPRREESRQNAGTWLGVVRRPGGSHSWTRREPWRNEFVYAPARARPDGGEGGVGRTPVRPCACRRE